MPASLPRRKFLHSIAAAGLGASTASLLRGGAHAPKTVTKAELDRILDAPVLDVSFVDRPVVVESLELLRNGGTFLVRARSTDGLEVITVPNPRALRYGWPILLGWVFPVFVGKDARALEGLIAEAYRHESNYKLQGLAYWSAIAAVETALLELMGRATGQPMARFFGGAVRRDIDVYYASGNRGNTPEEEVAYLRKLVAGSGVRAIKFRLGGRMSRNLETPAGRSERLIPLVREAFGPDMTLYADANSSYDVAEGIRIGRIMEESDYDFFEEPCPFDEIWETKAVADALTIPVAGGEQEFSLRRFQWAIEHRGLDIVQPDLHYGGGMIRGTKVARMAAAAGLSVVPHMSGGGLGYVDVVHFASFTPNIGPFMEFKGNANFPVTCPTSSLKCENGSVRCPTGPGWGVTVDPDFVREATLLSRS